MAMKPVVFRADKKIRIVRDRVGDGWLVLFPSRDFRFAYDEIPADNYLTAINIAFDDRLVWDDAL